MPRLYGAATLDLSDALLREPPERNITQPRHEAASDTGENAVPDS
jgi:hypothetical protein